MKSLVLALALLGLLPSSSSADADRYVVALGAPEGDAYEAAACEIASLHAGATIVRFDPVDLDALSAELRAIRPRYVCVVLPREAMDVKLARRFLLMATGIDEDPFVDFSYGFVTGADAEGALAFARNIARKAREGTRTKSILSCAICDMDVCQTWEEDEAGGWKHTHLAVGAGDADRATYLLENLPQLAGNDLIHLTGHGGPDGIGDGWSAADIAKSGVDLYPAVAVSCACYTGVVGKCYFPDGAGGMREYDSPPDQCFALALIRAGVTGYFAGVDGWHGLISMRVVSALLHEGVTCGDAARETYDRMVLQWREKGYSPERILEMKEGDLEEARCVTGSNMVFFGDPASRVRDSRPDRVRVVIPDRNAVGGPISLAVRYEAGEAPGSPYSYYTCEDFGPQGRKEIAFDVALPAGEKIDSVRLQKVNVEEASTAQVLWGEDLRGRRRVLHVVLVFPGDANAIAKRLEEEGLSVSIAISPR